MIFIKPYIINNEETATVVTADRYNTIRYNQLNATDSLKEPYINQAPAIKPFTEIHLPAPYFVHSSKTTTEGGGYVK